MLKITEQEYFERMETGFRQMKAAGHIPHAAQSLDEICDDYGQVIAEFAANPELYDFSQGEYWNKQIIN